MGENSWLCSGPDSNEKMGPTSMGKALCSVFFMFLPVLCTVDNPTLHDVLAALERTVNFYMNNHKEHNLDGIYGLRVVEGQIWQILSRRSAGRYPHLSPSIVARLEEIHSHAQNICESALPHLRLQDQFYFEQLKPLVTRPTAVFYSYRRLDHSLRWTKSYSADNARLPALDESFGDDCMSEMMGTAFRHDEKRSMKLGKAGKCKVSTDCLKVMFSRGRIEYQLTHQLLYTLLAEMMGCTSVLDAWLRENGEPLGVPYMQQEFCTNNFAEVQEQLRQVKGHIYPIYHDLFMEQQFVCPILGFMEFLHFDWLKKILSWQRENGCFGKMVRQLPLHILKQKGVQYSYEDEEEDDEKDDEKDDESDLEPQPPHRERLIRDQFGVQVVKQVNDSTLELHHVPAKDMNVNAMVNQEPQDVPGFQWQKKQNDAEFRADFDRSDAFIGDSRNLDDRVKDLADRLTDAGILPAADEDAADSQQRDLGGLFFKEGSKPAAAPIQQQDSRMEPFGGNVQGFERDQLLQGAPSQGGQAPVQRREGFRRLLSYNSETNWNSRKLLVERTMEGGCLSHKTAVAIGAISQYLRFMVEPGTIVYGGEVRLDGVNHLMQLSHPSARHDQGQVKQIRQFENKLLDASETDNIDYQDDDLGENEEEDDDYANEKEDNLLRAPDRGEDGKNYDARDDEEDEDIPAIKHKMQVPAPNVDNLKKRSPHLQNADKEYEQYMDEEEDKQNLALNMATSNRRHNRGFQKDNLFDVLNKQHQEEESYSYYDNQDERPEAPANSKLNVIVDKDIQSASVTPIHLAPNPFVSPVRLYLIVTALTVVILYFMFKFVRRRRVVIRYYHH